MPAKAREYGEEQDLGDHAKGEHRAMLRGGHRKGRGPAAQISEEELGAGEARFLKKCHHGIEAKERILKWRDLHEGQGNDRLEKHARGDEAPGHPVTLL